MKKSVLRNVLFTTLLSVLAFCNAIANDHHHGHKCNHAYSSAFEAAFTVKCVECGKTSALRACSDCNGTGNKNYKDAGKPWEEDSKCYGSGKLHTDCGHAYINLATNPAIKCAECGQTSSLKTCSNCNGTGNKNYKDAGKPWEEDQNCKGSGKLHIQCSHGYVDQVVDAIPELVFANPVLISGTDGQEGAKYLFAHVAPGIDANMLLKKFSRPDIYMQSIDQYHDAGLGLNLGWDKAFQPRFGLPHTVAANEDWYIDFELTFLKSGSTVRETVDQFTVTSLDVDGDGQSLKEYVIMEKASSVSYAENTYFDKTVPVTAVVPACPKCGEQSAPVSCNKCGGDGRDGKKKCQSCKGVGKVYQTCGHPWDGQDATAYGPKDNFANIDTSATAVMATYIYNNKDVINFRIGANSGANGTHGGAGIRLNSMWFKGFNLNPTEYKVLPVKMHNFKAAKEARHVAVSWSAEGDESLSHFVVERSMDGKTFKDLGTVSATGDKRGNYAFNDMMPTSGTATLSYRIRMVDAAQQASYSSIAVVRLSQEAESNATIATYPNPVQDQLKIEVPGAWQGQTLNVAIYNSNGVQVEAALYPQTGARETMQISRLPKGIYIVKASTKAGAAQQTIYKN